MSGNPYQVADIRFMSYPASELRYDQWAEITWLNQQAVAAAYDQSFVSRPDVQSSIGADFNAYIKARIDPNRLVATAYNENNLYSNPQVTIGRAKREIVSVTYMADNVFGPTAEARLANMNARLPLKRWAWLGWTATAPNYQGRGIATVGLAFALQRYGLLRPISAEAWLAAAGESTPAHKLLERNGLRKQGLPSKETADSVAVQRYTGWVWRSRMNDKLWTAVDSTYPKIP